MGTVNERQFGSVSLGHTREAVKATSTIDVSWPFVTWDGTLGLKATLTNVNYNEKLNFNLISLTWLLCSGWSITSGNAAGIILTNGCGGVINFDIMIPTAHGAIFACWFVWDADVCVACTDVGTKMNILKAHGFLGHGDEETTRKTAQELSWMFTHGTLKSCQKNVCYESTALNADVPGGRVYWTCLRSPYPSRMIQI